MATSKTYETSKNESHEQVLIGGYLSLASLSSIWAHIRDQFLAKSCFMPDWIFLDFQFRLCLLSFEAKQTFWRIDFHPCWQFSELWNWLSIEASDVPNEAEGFASLKLFFSLMRPNNQPEFISLLDFFCPHYHFLSSFKQLHLTCILRSGIATLTMTSYLGLGGQGTFAIPWFEALTAPSGVPKESS